MYSYIARRLVFGALTVIGVSIMVFVVMRILPGDPLVAIFGPEGMTKLTDDQRASYMKELGLSDPLWVQYLAWVKDILAGNFGRGPLEFGGWQWRIEFALVLSRDPVLVFVRLVDPGNLKSGFNADIVWH